MNLQRIKDSRLKEMMRELYKYPSLRIY